MPLHSGTGQDGQGSCWKRPLHGAGGSESTMHRQVTMEMSEVQAEPNLISGSEAVDIAHRLGRQDNNERTRAVIILFAFRLARDLIWKKAKDSSFLRDSKLHFGEDLIIMDKEARATLWPLAESTRKEGKSAYFVGPRAYIDGKEIQRKRRDIFT
ncbi:unnamed protein product [Coregonus sp. 'balchen']|nr:unnamed protein product [Coregonus sp. 'balchen']